MSHEHAGKELLGLEIKALVTVFDGLGEILEINSPVKHRRGRLPYLLGLFGRVLDFRVQGAVFQGCDDGLLA